MIEWEILWWDISVFLFYLTLLYIGGDLYIWLINYFLCFNCKYFPTVLDMSQFLSIEIAQCFWGLSLFLLMLNLFCCGWVMDLEVKEQPRGVSFNPPPCGPKAWTQVIRLVSGCLPSEPSYHIFQCSGRLSNLSVRYKEVSMLKHSKQVN